MVDSKRKRKDRPKTLAHRIKRCRQALGMSKAQLAASANLPRAPITRYEREQTKDMSIDILKKLSQSLGVSTDYLAGRVKEDKYFQNPHLQKLIRTLKMLEPADLQCMHELYLFMLEKR